MRVAIQGETGSFHDLAARRWYGEKLEIVACQTFAEVFEKLQAGAADQAVVAIENSHYGSIKTVNDLVSCHGFPIVGELNERIHQNLITLPGTKMSDIKTIISHHIALEQCSDFLDRELPNAERVEYYDTAAAIDLITRRGQKSHAAIASQAAAEQAGLPMLAEKIENDSDNYTRFVVIDPRGAVPAGANGTDGEA